MYRHAMCYIWTTELLPWGLGTIGHSIAKTKNIPFICAPVVNCQIYTLDSAIYFLVVEIYTLDSVIYIPAVTAARCICHIYDAMWHLWSVHALQYMFTCMVHAYSMYIFVRYAIFSHGMLVHEATLSQNTRKAGQKGWTVGLRNTDLKTVTKGSHN